MLNILLYGLNITLLCVLKRLNVRATVRGYRILDIRGLKEEGGIGKHCLGMKNVGNAVKFEKILSGVLPS